jgi:hypothetical protein
MHLIGRIIGGGGGGGNYTGRSVNSVIYQAVTLGLVRTIQLYYTSPIALLVKAAKDHVSDEQYSVTRHDSDVTNFEEILTSTVFSRSVSEIALRFICNHQFVFFST